MSEELLQAKAFMHVWNNYPETRGFVRYNFNNPKNAMQGAQLKALGLQPGVADHMLLSSPMVWLECKLPNGKQSKAQKDFQNKVESKGHKYHIYTTVEEFVMYVKKYLL